jgi:hypothetical protein
MGKLPTFGPFGPRGPLYEKTALIVLARSQQPAWETQGGSFEAILALRSKLRVATCSQSPMPPAPMGATIS